MLARRDGVETKMDRKVYLTITFEASSETPSIQGNNFFVFCCAICAAMLPVLQEASSG